MRSRILVGLAVLGMLLIGTAGLQAQVKVLRVDPALTGPGIEMVHSPHIAVYDPAVPSRHKLYLFIVGTGGKATGSLVVDETFAKWGFHAISLDYEDNVIAVACAHSLDPSTFGRYRDAIVTGAQVSSLVKVNRANSILNRFQKLLAYLVKNDPKGKWSQFVTNGKPAWNRIIVGGHSQGSGHAAYIGKLFRVDRVLMFSGPQDYMDNLHRPAPWQAQKSSTPQDRFFAFLNLQDPFNVIHQIANCMVLMKMKSPVSLMVKPGQAIHGNYHILINNYPTKNHHGSTLFPQFSNVWRYMATTKIRPIAVQ